MVSGPDSAPPALCAGGPGGRGAGRSGRGACPALSQRHLSPPLDFVWSPGGAWGGEGTPASQGGALSPGNLGQSRLGGLCAVHTEPGLEVVTGGEPAGEGQASVPCGVGSALAWDFVCQGPHLVSWGAVKGKGGSPHHQPFPTPFLLGPVRPQGLGGGPPLPPPPGWLQGLNQVLFTPYLPRGAEACYEPCWGPGPHLGLQAPKSEPRPSYASQGQRHSTLPSPPLLQGFWSFLERCLSAPAESGLGSLELPAPHTHHGLTGGGKTVSACGGV